MDKQQLQQEIQKLLPLSSMEADEKTMWTIVIPSMSEEELIKFKAILEKEIAKLNEIYQQAIKK